MVLQQFEFVPSPPPLCQWFLYVGETVTVKPSYVLCTLGPINLFYKYISVQFKLLHPHLNKLPN